jgi:hypothetical protein
MYSITFEKNGNKVTKTAKKIGEVRRLVYLYSLGTQQEKEAQISDILSDKQAEQELKSIKNKPKKELEDVNL